MKTPTMSYHTRVVLAFGCLLSLAFWLVAAAQAANYTTTTSQTSGNNWTAAIWNPGPVSPSAGNTYECVFNGTRFGATSTGGNTANTKIRNPASAGVKTFPGDSLTLNTNTEIRAKASGAILNFPGVGGNPGLILKGGVLNAGDNTVFQITGNIAVLSQSYIIPADNGAGAVTPLRGFNFAGQLSGSGNLVIAQAGTQVAQEVSGTDNPYSGNWIVKAGWLRGSAPGSLGSGNFIIDPNFEVPMSDVNAQYALVLGPAQMEVMYDLVTTGTLTLTNGGMFLLHQNCTFTGVTVEGVEFQDGDYLYDDLAANYSANFPPGGSGMITVVPPPPPATAPTITSVISRDGSVDLVWSEVGLSTEYHVQRAEVNGGPYNLIAVVTGTNAFTDINVINGHHYYYVVAGANRGGVGPNSAQVIGKPNNIVTGLAVEQVGKDVKLVWETYAGATGYTLKRATVSGGPYDTVASGIQGNSYTDPPGLGRTFYYVIFADLPGGGSSGISAEVSAVTLPNAPIVKVSLYAGTVAQVAWTTSDPVVNEFVVEQGDGAGGFTEVGRGPATTNRVLVTGLSALGTYSFRVKAVNESGESAYSSTGTVSMPGFAININFANAINGSPANNPAATPDGYLQDIGEMYDVRPSGLSYGWDVDNTANSRWRTGWPTMDLRYTTMNHLQKPLPAGRMWEVEIPNGYYWVHLVAGDADNNDSVFQYDIEGVITGTYTPQPGARWTEFTKTVLVDDERLSINNGPLASNNKIAFIDIYRATPVPIAIAQQPVPQSGLQNHPLSLSVVVTNAPIPAGFYGATPIRYQWFHDGAPVEGATSATLSMVLPQPADSGNYYVVVSNYANVVTSAPVAVTVQADTVPPAIVSVGSFDGYSVEVLFSEVINTNEGSMSIAPENFVIKDSNELEYLVAQVIVQPDGTSAVLVLDASAGTLPLQGTFTFTALVLDDLAAQQALDVSAKGSVVASWRVNFANPSFATNYPGYVNDYGNVFDDRGNGFFYGWDADNTAFCRERNSANSPDKRYDTLNHLQKPLPAGRTWEIEIPDGDYQVHVVGGDPSNTDSVFQFDIEGAVTGTHTPVSGAWWGDFTTNVTVADGRLTVNNGPLASNNKIAFIDIYSSLIPVPVAIDQQPQSQTVSANSPVTLAVTITHVPLPAKLHFDVKPISYQWYKGGVPVEGATVDKLKLASAQVADAGNYFVVVANNAGAVTSRVATVTIEAAAELKLSNVSYAGGVCSFSVPTAQGVTYAIEYKNALEETAWKLLSTLVGNGAVQQVRDTAATAPMRFYRARVQ